MDGVDETHQVGWSVVVRGHAEEVTDEDKLAELRQTFELVGLTVNDVDAKTQLISL